MPGVSRVWQGQVIVFMPMDELRLVGSLQVRVWLKYNRPRRPLGVRRGEMVRFSPPGHTAIPEGGDD